MNLLAPVCGSTLLDLLELRASLRRQVARLRHGLREVRGEIRAWRRHRRAQELAGQHVPPELCEVWDDLDRRELELQHDLEVARGALFAVGAEIEGALTTDSLAG